MLIKILDPKTGRIIRFEIGGKGYTMAELRQLVSEADQVLRRCERTNARLSYEIPHQRQIKGIEGCAIGRANVGHGSAANVVLPRFLGSEGTQTALSRGCHSWVGTLVCSTHHIKTWPMTTWSQSRQTFAMCSRCKEQLPEVEVECPPGEIYPAADKLPNPIRCSFVGVAPPRTGDHFYFDPTAKLALGLLGVLSERGYQTNCVTDFLRHGFF